LHSAETFVIFSSAQDNNGAPKYHPLKPACCGARADSLAREVRLELNEQALLEKQHKLARREDTLKSIEKALHAKERMIQAREATLEAKIRW
jgi:hypothetical protein